MSFSHTEAPKSSCENPSIAAESAVSHFAFGGYNWELALGSEEELSGMPQCGRYRNLRTGVSGIADALGAGEMHQSRCTPFRIPAKWAFFDDPPFHKFRQYRLLTLLIGGVN
jgi:hypothetical protein